MKKKIIMFVLAICMIIPCAFLFSACGNQSSETSSAETSSATYTVAFAVNNAEYGSVDRSSITVPYGTSVSRDGDSIIIGDETITGTGTEACYGLQSWGDNVPNTITENITLTAQFDVRDISYWGFISYSDSAASVANVPAGLSGHFEIPRLVKRNGVVYPVTSISLSAFSDRTGLTSITIPNSVTSIGTEAFYGCTGLASITIPNSVTSIGNSAFYGCTGLTSITIPNSVIGIGNYAFCDCTELTSITIPNSVTSIEDYAFGGCTGLTSIVVEEGNTVYDSRNNCNAIIETSTNELIYGCENTVIPNSVTNIGNSAFEGCTGLTSITIPNSVIGIGIYAFRDCTGLTSITIPNSVTSIEDHAFVGCTGLTSIVVEEGNTVYDSRNNCNAIIETSTNELIYGCKNTVIPNSVTSIGTGAFVGCTGLASITIPNSVTSIGNSAFEGCTGLTSITIPNSVIGIGNYAFGGCMGLTSITIPSVTSIGDGAFSGCTGLTSITIPNSVTSIGNRAFNGCTGLTSITIPNSVTSIGIDAFNGCTGLTSITIPNSVISIGYYAFGGCTGLTIYAEAGNKPDGWAGSWNFSNCPVYWYSETSNTDGHHWHYDTDGVTPVIW